MLTMVSDVVPGEGTKLGSSGATREGEGREGGEGGEGGEGEERGEGEEGGGVDIGIGDVTLGKGCLVLPLSLVRGGGEGKGV